MFYFERSVLLVNDYKIRQVSLPKVMYNCAIVGSILLDLKRMGILALENNKAIFTIKRYSHKNHVLYNFLRLINQSTDKSQTLKSVLQSIYPSLDTLNEMILIHMQQQKMLRELPHPYSPILTKDGQFKKAEIVCELLEIFQKNSGKISSDFWYIKLIDACNLTPYFLLTNKSIETFRAKANALEKRLDCEIIFEVSDDFENLELAMMNTILSCLFSHSKNSRNLVRN